MEIYIDIYIYTHNYIYLYQCLYIYMVRKNNLPVYPPNNLAERIMATKHSIRTCTLDMYVVAILVAKKKHHSLHLFINHHHHHHHQHHHHHHHHHHHQKSSSSTTHICICVGGHVCVDDHFHNLNKKQKIQKLVIAGWFHTHPSAPPCSNSNLANVSV